MGKLNKLLKLSLLIIFVYILIFSIQNFWQGYHDTDTAFNFLNLGLTSDINTGGQEIMLNATYLRGVDRMTSSFVWLCLDVLVGLLIGYLWRSE